MNFKEYWMKLSQDEIKKIMFQKAIPMEDVEELRRIIDSNEENSLIAISYSKKKILRALARNKPFEINIFSDLTYKITNFYKDGEPQQKTELVYSINRYKLNNNYFTPLFYDFRYSEGYRNKKWPHNGLEKMIEKDSQNFYPDTKPFQFLQSQGGFSFEIGKGLNGSYWKIVSLFPDSKTHFLNWSDSEPWEAKE